ncbi:MAG: ATP-binding cassette domain-containing protein [Nitrososphaerota archaeon]|jgi:ABC-2 type transport system ATP-binding protein|nr:ATP-binding cassette domain-containing protein [Nitrososphaerota archaeon]MDG6928348.1 ATP-binding cassette domain-containing protein [Nitrososphaerota archaeon]MDG6930683.1 ATP-binding cassette domain-containing protein [Nitrososphaerota archaeon]MDG6932574.1 ATP-binding cassette domain-containing protein [Nitrososphaerota archaeon]MDG6935650.1 ATP-binding cassette domain-containing protein [Nitrososphaerota archaeon]
MTDSIIKVVGLTKIYNHTVLAVDHISFEVNRGEIFGLLGPNGAGKSTTIGMLNTLLKPTEGTALIDGIDVTKEPSNVRKIIGVVPQEYTADEDLTGWENVMLIADFYGISRDISRQRAKELLEMVGLTEASKRKVETYSGGMRRRLELAMGLINKPKVLFLDEPTLGLDVQTRTAIWEHIRKLKSEYNMTILVTTHYLEEADEFCDRIAIIDRGKIVKADTPENLKKGVGGDIITIQLTKDGKDVDQALKGIQGVTEVKNNGDGLITLKVIDGGAVAPAIIKAFTQMNLNVTRLTLARPTMDEVYMTYTGRNLREEQATSEETFTMRRTMRTARS